MNTRAQGALEYLLILAGAVLIAAIVLTILAGTGQDESGKLAFSTAETKCNVLDESRCQDLTNYISYNDFCTGTGAVVAAACDLSLGPGGTADGADQADCKKKLDGLGNYETCIPAHAYYKQ